jgi:fructose-bisphosphate aldolase, class II
MNVISAKPLVEAARQGGYAVPAFNTNGGCYDITRAALEAAQEMRAPLILQVYEPNTEYRGFEFFVMQAKFLGKELGVTVPVALHLDHGHSYASVLKAMRAGMTSVMIDASHDPIEENIRKTCEVVRAAHTLGVSVEAEIGYVTGNEPKPEHKVGRVPVPERPTLPPGKTTVEDAVRFVRETPVDMLAVAIGTTHGVYAHQSDIDFDLLAKLRHAVPLPLVQHGTCGISHADLRRLASAGMAKINFGEPFRYEYIRYFSELTDTMEHAWHPWRIMREVKNRLKADMQALITACGAEGKAP